MLMDLEKNHYTEVRHKHVLPMTSFASFSHYGMFSKGRSLSAWPGRELQHVSSVGCLGPAFALFALQHVASPSVWGKKRALKKHHSASELF